VRRQPAGTRHDIVAAPLALGIGDHDRSRVQVIKSIKDQTSGDPTFITRDIAYSVGQRDWIQGQRSVSVRNFYTRGTTAQILYCLLESNLLI